MTAKLLEGYKSKNSCRYCNANRLVTNGSEKDDAVVYYHCLNCNSQYFETAEEKEYYKQQEGDKKEKKESNSLGITLIILIIAVILSVTLSRNEEERNRTLQPTSSVETFAEHIG
ncbi:MAG: hypothetical protein AAFP20_11365 [Cyanobacteria bacterium J06614_10]